MATQIIIRDRSNQAPTPVLTTEVVPEEPATEKLAGGSEGNGSTPLPPQSALN
jgi:hypothetical protein